jgi:bifunctional non-homologous end joining protein LigD
MAYKIKAGRRTIEVSNPDKILFPGAGITKADLADYYYGVAAVMLPELKGRLVTMERFPEGIEGQRFFQKDISKYFPDWIARKTVPKEGGKGKVTHVVCNDRATLLYLANQACITPHATLSREDRVDDPDQIIFDLDPSVDRFADVRRAALRLRELLEELGFTPFVKTTGSRGLHIMVPITRRIGFDDVRHFARDVARYFASLSADRLTVETRKNKRGDRIFVDWLRNANGQHAVAPYAVRARPGAPVAMPIEWDEVADRKLTPQRYSMKDVLKEVEEGRNSLHGWHRHARSIIEPIRKLQRLTSSG